MLGSHERAASSPVRTFDEGRWQRLLRRFRRPPQAAEPPEQAAAELAAVLEAVPVAVCVGKPGGVPRCNAAALRTFGVSSPLELKPGTDEFCFRFRVRHRREGDPVEVEDLPFRRALAGEVAALDAWITRADTGEDVRLSAMAVPVLLGTKVAGAVVVYCNASAFEGVAGDGPASKAVQAAREDERLRMARDLHDDLGQILAGLALELASLESRLLREGRSAPWIEDWVISVQSQLDEASASVRRIASGLRAKPLESLGLDRALREAAERFQGQTGIPVEVTVAALPDLPRAAENALYRIAEESLTNVARHANASHVALRLDREGDALVLRVEDDGRGPEGDPGAGAGLGLLGMRERAGELGGYLRWERGARGGMTVEARLPIGRAAGGGREGAPES